MTKLSIVIPVYNVEKYLAKCLDSVIFPGLDSYEVIVVNDGSTDGSGTIAADYAARYPSLLRLIEQENGGLGAARNTGLEAARGEFVCFLDSDDWLRENAVPEMLEKLEAEMRKFYPEKTPIDRSALLSYAMYPKVFEEYIRHRKEYGYIMRMGSHVFFNGMALGETNKINIEDGKTLVIRYLGLGDQNEDGTRNVQFELNGMRREVAVPDPAAKDTVKRAVMADPKDKSQVGASIPGMVARVNVKPGDRVEPNQVLAVIEAMKMETSVVARMAGTVDQVTVHQGQTVQAGELIVTIQ